MTQIKRVYAISCRLEVAADVVSTENAKSAEFGFEAASISSFRENQNQPFAQCIDDGRPTSDSFLGQGATMSKMLHKRK